MAPRSRCTRQILAGIFGIQTFNGNFAFLLAWVLESISFGVGEDTLTASSLAHPDGKHCRLTFPVKILRQLAHNRDGPPEKMDAGTRNRKWATRYEDAVGIPF